MYKSNFSKDFRSSLQLLFQRGGKSPKFKTKMQVLGYFRHTIRSRSSFYLETRNFKMDKTSLTHSNLFEGHRGGWGPRENDNPGIKFFLQSKSFQPKKYLWVCYPRKFKPYFKLELNHNCIGGGWGKIDHVSLKAELLKKNCTFIVTTLCYLYGTDRYLYLKKWCDIFYFL